MASIDIKRIYDDPSNDDGYRILVDRVWPRGISKARAQLDAWKKELAPSTSLRQWFDHREERFSEFARKYALELADKQDELKHLCNLARTKKICLLYGSRNQTFNQAVVLRNILNARIK